MNQSEQDGPATADEIINEYQMCDLACINWYYSPQKRPVNPLLILTDDPHFAADRLKHALDRSKSMLDEVEVVSVKADRARDRYSLHTSMGYSDSLHQFLLRGKTLKSSSDAVKLAVATLNKFKEQARNDSNKILPDLPSTAELTQEITDIFIALSEYGAQTKKVIPFIFEGVHLFQEQELAALLAAGRTVAQQGGPLALVCIGQPCPVLFDISPDSAIRKRLWYNPFIELYPSQAAIARLAIQVDLSQYRFTDEAIKGMANLAKENAALAHQLRFLCYDLNRVGPIEQSHVMAIINILLAERDAGFFIQFSKLVRNEKLYLYTLAKIDKISPEAREVAGLVPFSIDTARSNCSRLVDKNLLYRSSRGCIAYVDPLFAEFIRRVMPKLLGG